MELHEQVARIQTKEDFIAFVERLSEDLYQNPNAWENPTLHGFLGALARWTGSMENFFRNTGMPIPPQPSWQLLGEMLLAARIYE